MDLDISGIIKTVDWNRYSSKLNHIQNNNYSTSMHNESKIEYLYDLEIMGDKVELAETDYIHKLKKIETNS